jgi:hypothetical protein
MGIEEPELFDWLREGANVLVLAMGGGAIDGRQVKRATVVRIEGGVVTTDDLREFSAATLERIGGEVSVPSEILAGMADPDARTLLFLEESKELEGEAEALLAVAGPRDDVAVARLADARQRLVDLLSEFVAEVAPLFPGGDQGR